MLAVIHPGDSLHPIQQMRLPPQLTAHLGLTDAGVGGRLPLGGGSHVDVSHPLRVLLAVDVQVKLGGQLVGAVRKNRVEDGRRPGPIIPEGLGDSQQMIFLGLGTWALLQGPSR
jgi:hypothetical protein